MSRYIPRHSYLPSLKSNDHISEKQMSIPVIEKILGNNSILTNNYIKDTINLAKSIVVLSDTEAKLYNTHLEVTMPGYIVDKGDKTTWRYYRHLASLYHPLDTVIQITSLDNGTTIPLTKTALNLHKKTRKELLKYGMYYKELIDLYPSQELYIRSTINDSLFTSITDIIKQDNYTIISYNKNYIEPNELDLITELQIAINNYKTTKLIPYYHLSDSLFMAAIYQVLYNYIVTKILGIRLANAKTIKAHSFHIKNYLSSHHYLGEYYHNLTNKQTLFLYRNLLYLNNHSGKNSIFKTLIDKLFTSRGISIVNYDYEQINNTNYNYRMEYKFVQKLLNNTNLSKSLIDYSLQDIAEKEYKLTLGNKKELTYNFKDIDNKLRNSLFNTLITKDLETIVYDSTDSVRRKLIPTIVDYWAYLLKTSRINYITTIVDPVTNRELRLNTSDTFKLYTIVLYKTNNLDIEEFPEYRITSVFKDVLPDTSDLLKLCYKKHFWYKDTIDDIKGNIPPYELIATSSQFENYLTNIYRTNIGLWVVLSNLDDKHSNGQFELMLDRLSKVDHYTPNNNETTSEFLTRINIESIVDYNKETLDTLLFNILNSIFDNKLNFLFSYEEIQKSMIEIFKKFNSYTVQIIDNYFSDSPYLVGHKDVRCTISQESVSKLYFYDKHRLNIEMYYRYKYYSNIRHITSVNHSCSFYSDTVIPLAVNTAMDSNIITSISIPISNKIVTELVDYNWITMLPSTDQLEFLALNS